MGSLPLIHGAVFFLLMLLFVLRFSSCFIADHSLNDDDAAPRSCLKKERVCGLRRPEEGLPFQNGTASPYFMLPSLSVPVSCGWRSSDEMGRVPTFGNRGIDVNNRRVV